MLFMIDSKRSGGLLPFSFSFFVFVCFGLLLFLGGRGEGGVAELTVLYSHC